MSWSIQIPKVDANVTRALVAAWLARDGDHVDIGTPLVEVETEKAVFELVAQQAGTVTIALEDGSMAAVGQTIGYVSKTGVMSSTCLTEGHLPVSKTSRAVDGIDSAYLVDDYSEALLDEQ